jgi:hypothetical protein
VSRAVSRAGRVAARSRDSGDPGRLFDDLPHLRIVPTPEIHLHEEFDSERVGGIAREMRRRGILTNPPIVAPIPGHRAYVLLDGANRVMAARELAFPHILVQIVDYENSSIELSKWDHLVRNFSSEEFFGALEGIAGLHRRRASLAEAREGLAGHGPFCFVHHPGRGTVALQRDSGAESDVKLLREITGIYKDRGTIARILVNASLPEDIADAESFIVMFPTFTKQDILRCALSPLDKLPTGISRHVIPNRALRVNLPLSVLRSRKSLVEKNRALNALIAERARRNAIRHYTEATFIYDE